MVEMGGVEPPSLALARSITLHTLEVKGVSVVVGRLAAGNPI